jgi:hypothetical protein
MSQEMKFFFVPPRQGVHSQEFAAAAPAIFFISSQQEATSYV